MLKRRSVPFQIKPISKGELFGTRLLQETGTIYSSDMMLCHLMNSWLAQKKTVRWFVDGSENPLRYSNHLWKGWDVQTMLKHDCNMSSYIKHHKRIFWIIFKNHQKPNVNKQYTPPKTNMDTRNDDLENATPFKNSNFMQFYWHLYFWGVSSGNVNEHTTYSWDSQPLTIPSP